MRLWSSSKKQIKIKIKIKDNLVPKLRLGSVNGTGSSASTTQSWSFSGDGIPKLELGNETVGTGD
jgi:hypothetical protein